METIKDVFNFGNAAIFYEYEYSIIDEINQARKCIIYNFHETIPVTRRLKTLSTVDDVILKIHDTDFENVIEIIHVLRANIL